MLGNIDTIAPFGIIYYIIYLPGCLILFLLVNDWLGKKKAARPSKRISARRDTAQKVPPRK